MAIGGVSRPTTTIPIDLAVGERSRGRGPVASLARPGGNITGLELRDTDLAGKRLALFKEAVPEDAPRRSSSSIRRYGIHARVPSNMEAEAGRSGCSSRRVEAGSPETFEAAFAAMMPGSADALLIMESLFFSETRAPPPGAGAPAPTADHGGRAALCRGREPPGLWRASLSSYVSAPRSWWIRSERCQAPDPVERADKFYLVVNLKTAQSAWSEAVPDVPRPGRRSDVRRARGTVLCRRTCSRENHPDVRGGWWRSPIQ